MSENARIDRRRLVALAAVVIASIASVASLDMAAPSYPYSGTLGEQSVALTEAAPDASVTVHVSSTVAVAEVTLTINLTASWPGFSDAGADDASWPGFTDAGAGGSDAGDAGAPDLPIVEATLDVVEATLDAGVTLDRAITTSPGTGALILTTTGDCTASDAGCATDFTFTLGRIEPVPSGAVTVHWTATASVLSDDGDAGLDLTVSP